VVRGSAKRPIEPVLVVPMHSDEEVDLASSHLRQHISLEILAIDGEKLGMKTWLQFRPLLKPLCGRLGLHEMDLSLHHASESADCVFMCVAINLQRPMAKLTRLDSR
jgi:hypothetical protein